MTKTTEALAPIMSVEEYYLYESQSNSFAPPFDELATTTQDSWQAAFAEYLAAIRSSKPQEG